MNNIKNDIKSNNYKRIYLFFGPENYLKKYYTDKIIANAVNKDDTLNFTKINGDDLDVTELIATADTMPFFSDRRLIVVYRSGIFKDNKKEEINEKLGEYIKYIPETTVIVFVEDEADKRMKLYKAIKENGYVCEFTTPDEKELRAWIGGMFAKFDKKITASTADFLMEYVGTDMETLEIEIQKLSFYAMDREAVTPKDIEALCTKQISAVIFELTDAISNGEQKRALKVYEDLVALREPVQKTFFMLLKHFMQLIAVKEYKSKGLSRDEIARSIGAHPFTVQNLMRQSGNFTSAKLRKMLDYGVTLEHDWKMGRISEKNIVELFILQ